MKSDGQTETLVVPDGYRKCLKCGKLVINEAYSCPYCGLAPKVTFGPPYHIGLIMFTFLASGVLFRVAYLVFFTESFVISIGCACLAFFSLILACTMLFVNAEQKS